MISPMKIPIANFQIVANQVNEMLRISFFAWESWQTGVSKKCFYPWYTLVFKLIFLRNYQLDFFEEDLNRKLLNSSKDCVANISC